MKFLLESLILLTWFSSVKATMGNSDPQKVESIAFEEVIAGKKIVDHLLETLTVASVSKCGLACNENKFCRSFNFCGEKSCELNSEDIYSTGQGTGLLSTAGNIGKNLCPVKHSIL